MIIDKSGIPSVGLSLLRANLDKLSPPRRVELKLRGQFEQVLMVEGPSGDTYESWSFGWGAYSSSENVQALSQALELVGAPTSFEDLKGMPAYSQEYRLV